MKGMKTKRLLATLLLLCLTLGLCACGDGAGDKSEASGTATDFTFEKEKFKGKKLTFWSHWDMSDFLEVAQEFMDQTGATIEAENVATYVNFSSKVSTAILADAGPDCFWMYPYTTPTWAKKGMIKPWDDILDITAAPFAGKLSHPALDMFTVDGKHYGLYKSLETHVFVVYYNKGMFTASGLEDPYALYQKGEWTWDRFTEIAEQLCYDSDADGVIDTFAFDGSLGNIVQGWLIANGANEVIWKDGIPKFGLTEPAAIEALEMYFKVATTYAAPNAEGLSGETNFLNEKIAMWYEGSYNVGQYLDKLGGNLGIVPLPKGPKADAENRMANRLNSVPFGIANTCKEPELLAHFMEYYFWYEEPAEKKAEYEAKWGDNLAMRDFLDSMRDEGSIANAGSFGNLTSITNGRIYQSINSGAEPATVVQAFANQAQSIIDEAMSAEE